MKKLLVCIDSPCDRTRLRATKIFLRYGERVQWSVYEFSLNETDLLRMRAELKSVDLTNGTQINLYYFPSNYKFKIERLGLGNGAPMADDETACFF